MAEVKYYELMRNSNCTGFSYVFEKELEANEEIVVKMPVPSANKRGVNDIGWQSESENVELYGTLYPDVNNVPDWAWEKINEDEDINKTVSGIKVINTSGTSCKFIVRAILF